METIARRDKIYLREIKKETTRVGMVCCLKEIEKKLN